MDIEKASSQQAKKGAFIPPLPYTGPTLMEPLEPESGYIGREWDNYVGGHVNKPKVKKVKKKVGN